MKLVLANNQSEKFRTFHQQIQESRHLYDYIGYTSLLFFFDQNVSRFINLENNQSTDYYDGVYLNGYLATPELAVTMAQVLRHNGIRHVNSELDESPALTKLSAYARLAAQDVSLPRTYGGSAAALAKGITAGHVDLPLPIILKRADADRGIDNYKLDSYERAAEILSSEDGQSLWVIQEFIPNDGFYLVSYYGGEAKFSIFRSLEERPDHNQELAHMYKPKGGANASLVELSELPAVVRETADRAVRAVNRQIASVDLLYSPDQGRAFVLEVNYNPQLVTIETFKDVRQQAFLEAIENL